MKFFSLFLVACACFFLFSLHSMTLLPDEKQYLSNVCGDVYFYLQMHDKDDLNTLRSCKFEPSAVDSFLNGLATEFVDESDKALKHLQSVALEMNDLTNESRTSYINELSRKLAQTDKEVRRLKVEMLVL